MTTQLKEILKQYLITGLWSEIGDNNEPLDNDYYIDDISLSGVKKSIKDIKIFLDLAGNKIAGIEHSQIGHDLLLTRNGHGTGFWDRGRGIIGDELSEIAETLKEVSFYVSDKNKIEIE